MVIGKITSLGSMVIIGAVAILFLRQAHATSFGHAGSDVGSGLTGISTGISNLFGSFISPITGLFGTITSLFNWGNDGRTQPTEEGRDERPEPQQTGNSSGKKTSYTGGGYVNAVGVADWLK